jgi:flagellar biosynthesis GTPase FlhF
MTKEKEIGLEDVDVVDFTDTSASAVAEKKNEEQALEGITSFPWKNVSHVVIGPNGVSLVPVGTEKKFSMPSVGRQMHPTPGQNPTVLEYDLEYLVGSMNAATSLEKELEAVKAELAKAHAELAELKKPKDEKRPPAEDKKENPLDKPEDEMKAEPPAEPPKEEEKKKKEGEPEVETLEEKSKEEIAKDEKKEAATKDQAPPTEKKTEDHSDGLGMAIKLMQEAKKRKQL